MTTVLMNFVDGFSKSGWRRCLLAIVAATNFGKSALGRYVLSLVAQKLGVATYLEVTVEEDAALDVSALRIEEHAGILLDGVADNLFLKPHRETLQGQPKVCWGGKSNTMMYAYPFHTGAPCSGRDIRSVRAELAPAPQRPLAVGPEERRTGVADATSLRHRVPGTHEPA